jgi:hypothetical protein
MFLFALEINAKQRETGWPSEIHYGTHNLFMKENSFVSKKYGNEGKTCMKSTQLRPAL